MRKVISAGIPGILIKKKRTLDLLDVPSCWGRSAAEDMRRSDCGRINTEAVLEQASGRIHSPEDRFKTKGGVSGEDNETRKFPRT